MATPTLIARETRLDGRIEGDEQVTVAGRVVGEISLTDALTVAEDGVIEGDVTADEVTIEGVLDGTIEADGVVVLTETARVVADIRAAGLILEDGAQLSGEIEVEGAGSEESSARSTGSQRRSRQSSSRRSPATTSTTSSSSSSSSSRSPRSTDTGRRSQSTSTTTKTVTEESSASASRTATTDEQTSESSDGESEESDSEDSSDAGDAHETNGSPDSSSEFVDMSRDEISDAFTVRELRDELRDRDLTVRGKKAVLIDRLKDFVASGD